MKLRNSLLTCMVVALSIGSLVQLMASNDYVTSLDNTNGKIVINNEDGYYVGFSMDYTKNNNTGTSQVLETDQGKIEVLTELSSVQLAKLRFMLAISPAVHWDQIQDGWPNVVTSQGVEDPGTWRGNQREQANVYVQYIIWNYIAKAHHDVDNFARLRPEAYQFVQNNPALVAFYESGDLIRGEQLDSIEVIIQNHNQTELIAGNLVGPFTVEASLSPKQMETEVFTLEKATIGSSLLTNINYYQFVDENSVPINKVKVDQPFYIQLSTGIYSDEIQFQAITTQTTYPVTMEDVLFHSEQDSSIIAIPMTAQSNLRYGEGLLALTVHGRAVDGRYSSSSDQVNGRILVDNGTGSYAGYSVDFTKPNTTLVEQTLVTSQSSIASQLGINETTLSHMRYMLAYSPAVQWKFVQENWPTIHTPTGDQVSSSWSEKDYAVADQYFQYILWGYTASATNKMNQLQASQPEAYAFLQSNPELVSLYASGTMAYGEALKMYEFTVKNLSNGEAKAPNDIGPFSIASNLSTEQSVGATYALSTLYYDSFPWTNASLSYFVDGQGLPLTKVKDGQEFYIRLLEGVTNGQLTFEIEGQTVMAPTSMKSVLFSANGEGAIFAVPTGANRDQSKQTIKYELPVVGREPGRYQWIWKPIIQIDDTQEGNRSYYTLCAEPNVYLAEGVGFDRVVTDPVDIVKEMGVSLESLYKLRYVYSKTSQFTPAEKLIQEYPSVYNELSSTNGPVIGVGGSYFFNETNFRNDAKFEERMNGVAQNMFWYVLMKESNSPRYQLPADNIKSLEQNPHVISYFYDRDNPSKSMPSLKNADAPTMNVLDESEITIDNQTKLIGPYTVESSIEESFNLELGDPSLEASISIVNEQKEVISELSTGESFYLLVEDNHPVNAVNVQVTSASEYFTRYQEYYFESRYIQNVYTIEPINEKISQSITIEWENEQPSKPLPVGSLVIEKVDADNPSIKLSAKFELRNSLGEVLVELTTDSLGKSEVDSIPAGDYELVEIEAPIGYHLAIDKYPITIVEGETNTLYTGENAFKNVKSKGDLTIDVIDADDEEIVCQGIVEIMDENGIVVEEVTLNDECNERIIELPTKSYKVRMKEAPKDYEINIEEYQTVIEEGEMSHVRIRVKRKEALVHIELIDEDTKEKICVGKVRLANEDGKEFEQEVGDPSCEVTFLDVPVGAYAVEITRLPKEYQANEESYPIIVEADQETHIHFSFKSIIEKEPIPKQEPTPKQGPTPKQEPTPVLPKTGSMSNVGFIGLSLLGTGIVTLLKKKEKH